MDNSLLIEQNFRIALILISDNFYNLTKDKGKIVFHDENTYDLFFIHLNEYVNTKFKSPIDKKSKHSLSELTMDFSKGFNDVEFEKFANAAKIFHEFMFEKKTYYKYISPHELKIETTFAELINIQANYVKHTLYHLNQIKSKLSRMFIENGIMGVSDSALNEHLRYFKEFVLDDKLTFNQTKIVEEVGKYFLALYDLIHSKDHVRIRIAKENWILKNGKNREGEIEPPQEMTHSELFHWEINRIYCWRFNKSRLTDLIPKTAYYFLEK